MHSHLDVALLATSSCSDDKFTDQYQDPSKTQTVSCPALMVGVWQASNTWMNPVYYRYYVSSTHFRPILRSDRSYKQ